MVSVSLSALGGAGWQFLDDSGRILSGGLLESYAAGGATPIATYTDYTGNTQNAWPVQLDSAGRPPAEIWQVLGTNYKYILKTSDGSLIRTYDHIPGIVGSADEPATNADVVTYDSYAPRTVADKLGDYRHLFDYIPNSLIPHADILANTSTADLTNYLQIAIDDLEPWGGELHLPPCDIRVTSGISVGNGTTTSISTKNGQVIKPDSYGGTDDGTFGAGERQSSTRILYVGAIATSTYLLTVRGPIRNVSITGIVLDCNGLCGYPFDFQHLMLSKIDVLGTRWRTGQGIAYMPDVALPYGATIGMFKNKLRIRTLLPWTKTDPNDVGSYLRGTQGFQYLGGWTANTGFSLNDIECEHVFDDAGTYAMLCRFIDNNQFRRVYTHTSDGLPPSTNPLNAGVGIRIAVPNTAIVIGENMYAGNIGGGSASVEWTFDSGATAANKFPDTFNFFGLLDYETVPLNRLAKVVDSQGGMHNGYTGAVNLLLGSTAGNLSTTTTEYVTPVGTYAADTNRFVVTKYPGRTGYVQTFDVLLGVAPGGAASRTFAVCINGVASAATVTFGAGESGTKRATFTTPPGLTYAADICVISTMSGTPAASTLNVSIGFSPTEGIL